MGYKSESVATNNSIIQEKYETVRQSIVQEMYDTNIASVSGTDSSYSKFESLANNTFRGKRSIDVFIGCFAFVFFLLAYPVFALFIKLSSRGPVLYKQWRTGQHGHEFVCYKFRTMHELDLRRIDGKPVVTQENDKRVFWFGSLLRMTNLDELPQVLNVLKGDMSLIGPRPYQLEECAHWNNTYDDFYYRYAVKPGISGLAQVKGYRGGTLDEGHMRKRLDYDLVYVEKQCLGLDLKILGQTIFKMIHMDTDGH